MQCPETQLFIRFAVPEERFLLRFRIDFHWTDSLDLSQFGFLDWPLPLRQTEGDSDQLVYVRGLPVSCALVVAGVLQTCARCRAS